jgi:hypothetical protein
MTAVDTLYTGREDDGPVTRALLDEANLARTDETKAVAYRAALLRAVEIAREVEA